LVKIAKSSKFIKNFEVNLITHLGVIALFSSPGFLIYIMGFFMNFELLAILTNYAN
jgi:hypothetical protein